MILEAGHDWHIIAELPLFARSSVHCIFLPPKRKLVNNGFSPQATKKLIEGKFSSYYRILCHINILQGSWEVLLPHFFLLIRLIKSVSPQVVCVIFNFLKNSTAAFDL